MYRDLGQHEKAIDDFNRALQIDLTHSEVYILRGFAYVELKQTQKALADFAYALKLGSQSPEIFSGLSLAHSRIRKYDKALFYINQAVQRAPSDVAQLI